MIGQAIKMECLKCSAPVSGGQFWHIGDRMGFLCRPCEKQTQEERAKRLHEDWTKRFGNILADLMLGQVRHLDSIHGDEPRLQSTEKAITAHLKQHSPMAGPDGKRWAVRGIPLGGGRCWTAGVFSLKEDAEAFVYFYGTFVNTEAKLTEIEKGVNLWDEDAVLDDWERLWKMRHRPNPQPLRPKLPLRAHRDPGPPQRGPR